MNFELVKPSPNSGKGSEQDFHTEKLAISTNHKLQSKLVAQRVMSWCNDGDKTTIVERYGEKTD